MWAAATGHSKLGIPKSVGEEFVRADAGEKPLLGDLSDFEAAEAIRDGELPSPTKYGDFWLFDLRITGTGAAYRDRIDEYAFRDPEKWLSAEFLKRCGGLPVIFEHPENCGLNSEEFQERSIGTIVLPYVKGQDVWGIAKIFNADAVTLMQTTHRSTSPGVTPPKGSKATTTENGTKVLAEGLPLILDHLAICEAGVWDKGGPAEGVRLDSIANKESEVTEEERKKMEEERDDAKRRADAAEAKLKEYEDKARKDAEGKEIEDKRRKDAEEKALEDKRRKDAEETERAAIEKAEKEKADKKRADRMGRHDSEKHEGKHEDCAKCDAMEAEMDKRKDGAANVENVNANEFEELKKARLHDSAQIASLTAQLAALNRQPTIEDSNEIAKAFHRADAAYQMLGEQAPKPLPGEMPMAYRRRVADGLRKHSERWKDQPINDSLTGTVFALTEDAIFADALHAAKNPTINDSTRDRLIERSSVQNGKTRTEFFGSSSAAFAPFAAPVMTFKFKQPGAARG